MTERFFVSLNENTDCSYPIYQEPDFSGLGSCIRGIYGSVPGRICVAIDSNVAALYLDEVRAGLSGLDTAVSTFCIPAGEENKNLNTVRSLCAFLQSEGFARDDLLLAAGGGVTGDLAGFAAAIYLRGIAYVQLPTSLLAQVDSSVGGKTAVDLDAAKNAIGAFHHPRAVYMNMGALRTLPEEEYASGLGEVIKTALLADRTFFENVLADRDAILQRDEAALSALVRRCFSYKAEIVAQDPQEKTGIRAYLNLGHTIGHAIESAMHFSWKHGCCVATGLLGAAYLSEERGMLSAQETAQIREGLLAFGLPVSLPDLSAEELLDAMQTDKKRARGRLRFVLLNGIGQPQLVEDVREEEIREALCRLV